MASGMSANKVRSSAKPGPPEEEAPDWLEELLACDLPLFPQGVPHLVQVMNCPVASLSPKIQPWQDLLGHG
eukprot:6737320-Prorocentrum_lima.AAC.1